MATRTVVAGNKLTIPTFRRRLVPRPELLERLDGDFRVTLVSAPAGYGKTATLASWAATVDRPLAWLSCDPSDVEATRFMSCLLSSIAATWPGVADDAFVLLEREGANTYDAALAVANELALVDDPGVIVVDDLHLAAPDPAILTAFIAALPERFRFVAGTRSDPPLSLARLRLRGDLLELRNDDLRFGNAELIDFFGFHDVALTGDELVRLHELTEGWPAGLQMAVIALQRGTAGGDFLEALASTDRSVGDFLLSEVLASLPPDLVEFLVVTSVFDSFTADLCASVTGVDDAARVLERLLAANLFLVPLDAESRWYRYHHLFGTFLRARLASFGTVTLHAAHDRAGRALEERGDVAGALHHAMVLGDSERAARVLRDAIGRSMSMSEGAQVAVQAVRLWLHRYGAAFVETEPTRVLEFVIGLITLDSGQDAPAWLKQVQQAHPDADGPLVALIEGAWGEYHQHRGEPLEAIRHEELAAEAVQWRPPRLGLLPLLYTVVARAHIQAGDLPRAGAVLDDALAHPVGSRVPDEVRHPALAAFVAARAGDLTQAGRLADHATRSADELGLDRHEPGRIFAGLARVDILIELNDDRAAMRLLDEVKLAGEASHRVTLQATIALQEARVARAVGDEAGAAAVLEYARVLHRAPDAALRHVFAEEAAAQALRFDPRHAAPLIEALDQARPTTQVLRACLALLEHDDRTAKAILAGLPPPATRRELVERNVLSALSVLERDVDRANDHLREALAASQSEGLVRTIIDHGPDVHRLLKAYAPSPAQETYVDELLAVAERAVAPARTRVATMLVEPLSERELTVLRYLCSRLTYQEIAAALYVSLNTVKSHVRSVYRKLGATSRTEAVEAGRRHALV